MKFVVTGGAGFIGSHLTKHLIKQGHSVTVVDNLRRGSMNNLKEVKHKIDFHEIDIADYKKMKIAVKNTDCVFHEAALGSVPHSYKEPEEYHRVNVDGTENIFKLGKELGFKIVYASSSSVYGNQTSFPIKEDAEKKPLNPYGVTKLLSEELATRYTKEDVQIIGMRYFNVYGIGQNENYAGVIPLFIDKLVNHSSPIINGDGEQIRSFTFVDDVVKANVLAFESPIEHAFLNIASDEAISINKLADTIIQLSGLEIEPVHEKPREGDIKISHADVSLAKELIRWSPKTSLYDGLKQIFPKIEI